MKVQLASRCVSQEEVARDSFKFIGRGRGKLLLITSTEVIKVGRMLKTDYKTITLHI